MAHGIILSIQATCKSSGTPENVDNGVRAAKVFCKNIFVAPQKSKLRTIMSSIWQLQFETNVVKYIMGLDDPVQEVRVKTIIKWSYNIFSYIS